MPLNQQKVIGIILDEVNATGQRCEGYRDMLRDTITEIIDAEREHQQRATTIQKDINDKCDAASRWLVKNESHASSTPSVEKEQ